MKATGIIRKLDELGRIVLPIELRRLIGLHEKDPVEVFVDKETRQIMLRKYQTEECLFCQSTTGLACFRNRFVCASCLSELNPELWRGMPGSAAARDARARPGRIRGESMYRLAEVMEAHPEASQSEWARMLGVTPGRISQLLRVRREEQRPRQG